MSQLRFDGRVVIVTGAGRGMGRAHAHLLAARGAKVVVNDLGTISMHGEGASADPAETVVREIRDADGQAVANIDSVATEKGAKAIVQTALDAFGRIDAVVHNAGIVTTRSFQDIPFEYYKKVIGVHLDGGFLLAQEAWPHMVKQRYGRIVLISSMAGMLGMDGYGDYASAKTGMIGLSRVLAHEGAEHGIRANVLGVGAYTRMAETEMRRWLLQQYSESYADKWIAWQRKYVRPELVSPAVVWLAHQDCPVSGEIFDSSGGWVKRIFLAETVGLTKLDLTPEDIRDNFGKICDEKGYRVFTSVMESFNNAAKKMVEAGAEPPPEPTQ